MPTISPLTGLPQGVCAICAAPATPSQLYLCDQHAAEKAARREPFMHYLAWKLGRERAVDVGTAHDLLAEARAQLREREG